MQFRPEQFLFLIISLAFGTFSAEAQVTAEKVSGGFCMLNRCDALIVSNSRYENLQQTLRASDSGSRKVETSLRALGFNVIYVENAEKAELVSELERFQKIPDSRLSLIYYVGIGTAFGDRKYIAPADAMAEAATDPERGDELLLSVGELFHSHPSQNSNINIINAAFQDPKSKGLQVVRGSDETLAVDVFGDAETVFLYSADVGEPSFDTDVFATKLSEALKKPGDIIRALAQLREAVAVSSGLAQYPEIRLRNVKGEPLCLVDCSVDDSNSGNIAADRLRELEEHPCDGDFSMASDTRKRYALLIGNNGYITSAWGRLSEPTISTKTLSNALSQSGFQVRTCTNLKLDKLKSEIADFHALLQQQTDPDTTQENQPVAFFYFSGHGAADPTSQVNYLIPTDSEADTANRLRGEAVSIDWLADGFTEASGQVMLVVDACRNALKHASNKSGAKGMVRFQSRPNILFAAATRPGEVAWEESGYGTVLADRILEKNGRSESEVGLVFRDVGTKVYYETNGKQQPITEGALRGRFFFQD